MVMHKNKSHIHSGHSSNTCTGFQINLDVLAVTLILGGGWQNIHMAR